MNQILLVEKSNGTAIGNRYLKIEYKTAIKIIVFNYLKKSIRTFATHVKQNEEKSDYHRLFNFSFFLITIVKEYMNTDWYHLMNCGLCIKSW